ncbi:hypothetical protein LDENG_00258310, partial [Lucifuga dentata]
MFLIHHSSSMLWEMIVSNVMCIKLTILGSNMQNGRYGPLSCSLRPRQPQLLSLGFS